MHPLTMIVAVGLQLASDTRRPEWAGETVPDTVVVLVERATQAPEGDARKSLLRQAEEQARLSLAGPDVDFGRRYALAVVLGLRANAEGGQTKVRAASDLSAELDSLLAAEPGHAGARHMLGRLHAGVRRMNRITRWIATNLLGGDELKRATWEVAEENLLYAEQQMPAVADHHLQLALLYRDTGRPHLAVGELQHVLAITPTSALEREVFAEASQVLADLDQR
jgi:hypothetical protein